MKPAGSRAVIIFIFIASLLIVLPHLSLQIAPHFGDNAQYYLRALGLAERLEYTTLEITSGTLFTSTVAPPAVPAVLATAMAVFGKNQAVAKIAFYLFELGALAGLFFFFRTFLKRYEALLAIPLIMLNPIILKHFIDIGTDLPFLSFSALLIALLYGRLKSEKETHPLLWFVLGMGFGGLFLVRYAGGTWFAGAALVMLIRAFSGRRDKKRWIEFAMLTSGGVVVIGLYLGWIVSQATHDLVFQWDNLLHGSTIGKNGSGNMADWMQRILHNITTHLFINMPRLILHEPRLLKVIAASIYLIFLGTGIWAGRKSYAIRFLLFIIAIHCFPYLFHSTSSARFMFPLLVLSLVPAVYGMNEVARLVSVRILRLSSISISHVFLMFLIAWFVILKSPDAINLWRHGPDRQYTQEQLDFRNACYWIRNLPPPDDTVLVSTFWTLSTTYCGLSNVSMYNFYNNLKVSGAKWAIILNDRMSGNRQYEELIENMIEENRNHLTEIYSRNNIQVYIVQLNN